VSWSRLKAAVLLERAAREKAGLNGKPSPDSALRDTENVPLGEDVGAYFKREVLPHAPDAWIDHEKTKIGYEIPFNRHFYVFKAAAAAGGNRCRAEDRYRPNSDDDWRSVEMSALDRAQHAFAEGNRTL
jgi:hypothetical protein